MTVDAPAPRNYAQETADTLRTQLELAPQRYAAEAQFAPKYQALQLDLVRQATPELLALYRDQIAPTMGQVEAASRAASRAGDIADIAKLGPQARAAIQGFAPEQTQIADILARNATSGLLAGSQLTPEQQPSHSTRIGSQPLRRCGQGMSWRRWLASSGARCRCCRCRMAAHT